MDTFTPRRSRIDYFHRNGSPMADPQKPTPARRSTKTRTTPVVLRPAQTVPISEEDYQRAVTALAAMIASWWTPNHTTPPDRHTHPWQVPPKRPDRGRAWRRNPTTDNKSERGRYGVKTPDRPFLFPQLKALHAA